MSHNLVTEMQKKLTNSKIATQIAVQRDMSPMIAILLSIPPVTLDPSPLLIWNQISIW